MDRRLLVCLLAVVAGCSALPVGGGPSTPTTGDVTPAPVPEDGRFPPGVTAEGVDDPTALATAHVATIDDNSYTLSMERVARHPNGTLHSRLRLRVQLGADRGYLADAATAGPFAPVFLGEPPARGVYWSNTTTYVRKLTRGNTTTYNEFRTRESGAGTSSYWVTTVAFGGAPGEPETFYRDAFAATSTRTVERRSVNGTPTYRIVGSGVRNGTFDDDVASVSELRLDANVTQQGLVRTLSLRYAGEVNGDPVTVRWTVRYRQVGTTAVERPDWVERAV